MAVVAIGMLSGAASAGAATSVAGQVRYAIDNNPDFSNLARTAQRHEYVILHPKRVNEVAQIKAANPDVKVLMYKDLSASINYPSNAQLTTGVSYAEANAEHPEWFLQNTSGQRFTFRNYSSLWAMDVGSPSYQKRWGDNVLSSLNQLAGFDGVFIDDTNPTMKGHYDVSKVAKYPSDAAYQQATESALASITPRFHAAGYDVVANIGHWGEYPEVGQSWLRYLDGAMEENFGKWGEAAGTGFAWEGHWENQLESLQYAQQQGKDYLAVTHSADTDAAAARYGWASLLLGAEGNAHFALHNSYTTENWFPEYEYDIGEPLGPESRLANRVHMRHFTNGVVVVNPTSGQLPSGPLSADSCATYSGSGHDHVKSVTLAANSAVILTRDSGTCETGGTGSTGTGSTGTGSTGTGTTGTGTTGTGTTGTGTRRGRARRAPPPGRATDRRTGTGSTGTGDTGGGTSTGDGTTVSPGSKKVKRGRVVAKGNLQTSGGQTAFASSTQGGSQNPFKGYELQLEVGLEGGETEADTVHVEDDGSFVGRIRVCEPGNYSVWALSPDTGERLEWPGGLRVRSKQLRC